MNHLFKAIYFAFFLIFFTQLNTFLYSQEVEGWMKVADKNGVVFFQKDTVERVKIFKAEYYVASSMNDTRNSITNMSNYEKWIYPFRIRLWIPRALMFSRSIAIR